MQPSCGYHSGLDVGVGRHGRGTLAEALPEELCLPGKEELFQVEGLGIHSVQHFHFKRGT